MILDTGIASFRRPADEIGTGNLAPQDGERYLRAWYGERTVGITRYFAAKQADSKISKLIRILRPAANKIPEADDICETGDGRRYRVVQVQLTRDEEAGCDVADLSLERIGDKNGGN